MHNELTKHQLKEGPAHFFQYLPWFHFSRISLICCEIIIFSLQQQTEKDIFHTATLAASQFACRQWGFLINLSSGQIFMSRQANFGPHIRGEPLESTSRINMTAGSLAARPHARRKTLLFCLHRLLAEKKNNKSVRTALVFYSSEETQWILCTPLSQLISVTLISSFAQKLWHIRATLMGSNHGRRPKGCFMYYSQPQLLSYALTSQCSRYPHSVFMKLLVYL